MACCMVYRRGYKACQLLPIKVALNFLSSQGMGLTLCMLAQSGVCTISLASCAGPENDEHHHSVHSNGHLPEVARCQPLSCLQHVSMHHR